MQTLSPAALGLAVRFAREELKLTSNDLAVQTGITPSSLSRTERGIRMLPLDEAARIGQILGLSLDSLIDRAHGLESAGVVKKHTAALAQVLRALDDGRAAATGLRAELADDRSDQAAASPA